MLLLHLRWEDRKWMQAHFPFVFDGEQEMPNSLKPSARETTLDSFTQQLLICVISAYHTAMLSVHQDKSLLQSRD